MPRTNLTGNSLGIDILFQDHLLGFFSNSAVCHGGGVTGGLLHTAAVYSLSVYIQSAGVGRMLAGAVPPPLARVGLLLSPGSGLFLGSDILLERWVIMRMQWRCGSR